MPKKVKKEETKVDNPVPVGMRTLNNVVNESLIDDNVKSFRDIQDKLIEIYAKKNHDYGDCFNEACNELGAGYAFSRIYDKTKRFQTLAKGIMNNNLSMEVQDETLEDTLMDLANYCVMFIAWHNNKKNKGYCPGEIRFDNSDKVYIDISTNLRNDVIKLVHEITGKPCTNDIIKQYGYSLVKDYNNYVYVEYADESFAPVTHDGILVKVVPNK